MRTVWISICFSFLSALEILGPLTVEGSSWKPQRIDSVRQFHDFSRADNLDIVSRGGESSGGKAGVTASVFNLVNNVAGAGILTLASGMASGTGWIPAILICAFLGALSGHSFTIIGEACEMTGEKDFKVRIINRFCRFNALFVRPN